MRHHSTSTQNQPTNGCNNVVRAAQRAFRERKQSQLAELQARVQQYEQGEIERNVALQNIAKRLKEENEKLRKDNAVLTERLAAVEEERDTLREMSRKRWREDSVPQTPVYNNDMPSRKKSRVLHDLMDSFPAQSSISSPSYFSSPASSAASSPGSNDHTSFSPMPSLPPPRDGPVFPQGNALSNIFDFISSGKSNLFEPGGAFDTYNCGFCSDSTPCVCRELAVQQVNNLPLPSQKVDNTGSQRASEMQIDGTPMSTQQASILENLPAYQPPVPLRRRGGVKSSLFPVFPIAAAQQQSLNAPSPTPASCTGDPSNCPACADDAFGQAFCAAISKSVASSSAPCGDCPSGSEGGCNHGLPATLTANTPSTCCGNPGSCCRARESASQGPSMALSDMSQPVPSSSSPFNEISVSQQQDKTIPCDDVWRQIKSHPNVAFADLDLLAEVVARRAKCTGPRVEIFPAPGSITPERGISPLTLPTSYSQQQQQTGMNINVNVSVDMRPGSTGTQLLMPQPHHRLLNNTASSSTERERRMAVSPSLQLVPQEILVQCGRQQRVREVHADAVRDALRLLDAKFSLP